MLDFAKKLLIARELRFEKGKFELLGQRVLVLPEEFVIVTVLQGLDNPEFEEQTYDLLKKALFGFASRVKHKYNISPVEMSKLFENLGELTGFCEIQPIKKDFKELVAIYHVKNLPTYEGLRRALSSEELQKYGNRKVDRYMAGVFAGVICSAFDRYDMECIETKCMFRGDPVCEFIIAPREKIKEYLNSSSG